MDTRHFGIILLFPAFNCFIFDFIIKTSAMDAAEIQDFINVYSMIRFADGHREPGIIMSKYNKESGMDYFFVQHNFMNDYKKASDHADYRTCEHLSVPIDLDEIINISPINLTDYKLILEIHN